MNQGPYPPPPVHHGYPPPQGHRFPPPQYGVGGLPPPSGPTHPYGGYPPPPPGFHPPPHPYQENYQQRRSPFSSNPYQDPYQQGPPPPADEYLNVPQGTGFDDKTIRKAFIRKVFTILSLQLAVTTGIVALFTFWAPFREFAKRNPWILLVSTVLLLVVTLAMSCCENVRRKVPGNFICLGIYTICESILLGYISVRASGNELLMAAGITVAICFGLTLLALQPWIDFTWLSSILLVLTFVLMGFGFIVIFFVQTRNSRIVLAALGTLIFSMWLVVDIQMIVGGTHKYQTDPEEYIFAALNIYIDIVQIFLCLLRLIQLTNGGE